MNTLLLSLTALCDTSLSAQHPAETEPAMPTPPQSITQIISDAETAPRKQLLPDSRIVIVRNGRSCNVSGQEVK